MKRFITKTNSIEVRVKGLKGTHIVRSTDRERHSVSFQSITSLECNVSRAVIALFVHYFQSVTKQSLTRRGEASRKEERTSISSVSTEGCRESQILDFVRGNRGHDLEEKN